MTASTTPPTTPPIRTVRFPGLWSEVLLAGRAVEEEDTNEAVFGPRAAVAKTVMGWLLLMMKEVAITGTMVLPPETIKVVKPEIVLLQVEVELVVSDSEDICVWVGDVFGVVSGVGEVGIGVCLGEVGIGVGVGEVVGNAI
jgi:hypothetical protein